MGRGGGQQIYDPVKGGFDHAHRDITVTERCVSIPAARRVEALARRNDTSLGDATVDPKPPVPSCSARMAVVRQAGAAWEIGRGRGGG